MGATPRPFDSGPPYRVYVAASVFTFAVLTLGYVMLGVMPMLLFAGGYVVGQLIWLVSPVKPTFASIRTPFFLTLVAFVLHKLEERYLDFFPALSRITGVPVPEQGSWLVILLYVLAGVWIFIPPLVRKRAEFGYYLAWTFFVSMGVTELAHFAFPLFDSQPGYGYFPGMISAALLAPVAWWGIWRMFGLQKKRA